MSDLQQLKALRPADDTPEAIQAAISEAEARHREAIAEAEKIEKRLPKMLLEASDAEIEKAELQMARAKRTADRLTALLAELRPRLEKAKKASAVAAVVTRRKEVARLSAEFVARWRAEYPQLAEGIRELLLLEQQIWAHVRAGQNEESNLGNVLKGIDLPGWELPGTALAHERERDGMPWALKMGTRILLPSVHGITHHNSSPRPFWCEEDARRTQL